MLFNLAIVKIDMEYCNFLRQYDYRVAYNSGQKQNRPFIGVLFQIRDMEYFAPLSSPKAKHLKMKNTLDFIKIDSGRLGAVNFNNMIPVKPYNYEIVNVNRKNLWGDAAKYQELLKDQLAWLNENKSKIIYKADSLYALYIAKLLPKRIAQRCCNFPLLEEKCEEYNKVLNLT